jgi:GntR family transcriptional regulator
MQQVVVADSPVPPGELTMPPRSLTYREIADDIHTRIARSEAGYRPGDQLPSYAGLAELYSVSVSTAARAVGLLTDRGVIESVIGRGVYVREPDAGRK